MIPFIARHVLLTCIVATSVVAQSKSASTTNASESVQIRLHYASFDPLVSEPAVPAILRGSGGLGGSGESALWIMQFVGSPTAADRTAVAAVGGQIVSYLPDNAYVVRMTGGAAASVTGFETVRWVGQYHAAYRLDSALLPLQTFTSDVAVRYNIVVANKHTDKPALVHKVQAIGGTVEDEHFGSILIDATLTGPQLLQVVGFDEVLWVDLWGDVELHMDNCRVQGGADYVESQAGYTGAGVNAHVYEGVEWNHLDFTGGAINVNSNGSAEQHGHATAGIVWGNGTSNPAVRGMAPDCGKYYTELMSVTTSRWQVFSDLVNVHNVSHTSSSWGYVPMTIFYNSISAESDDMIFDHDIAWTQSQANDGAQTSASHAWAKNIFSIGGVAHSDDANPLNDSWMNGGASIGPAADGRFKPTLCAYYDDIGTSDLTGAAGYSSGDWMSDFGGTSGAAPIVAGHNVIAIQMFADDSGTPGVGKFGNALRMPGGSAHENRPHFTTLKALQVVSADQYAFTAGSIDNRREHQGWGFPNLQNMWDRRGETFIIDETSVLEQGSIDFWEIAVAVGEPSLKISLNWSEPAANPAAAQTLINNLSLRLLAPDGTEYWGNVGLEDGVWSVLGGSEDTVNSIENIFVQNPMAGNWYAQVIATSVVMDNHIETATVDADYALVVVGGVGQPAPQGLFGEVETVGFGCDGTVCVDAIYEYPTFGLANSSLTLAYNNGDYALLPGQGTWIAPAGAVLAMADNTEVVQNNGFTLPFPGGTTGSFNICSNGWITTGPFLGSSNVVPTPADFMAQTMWAPMWRDLNPAAGGLVRFDSSAARTVISWVSVPNFPNVGASTFQVQFWSNGDVHYIYQNVTAAGDSLVGFSKAGANDPGSANLSSSFGNGLSVCTSSQPELRFDASARPVLGTTFDLVTSDIPVGTLFGMAILSVTELNPGISLTTLGMPGCELYQTLDVTVFWAQAGNSAVIPWPLPSNPSLAGFEVYAQSAALTPGINAFGYAISNGLKLIVGIN